MNESSTQAQPLNPSKQVDKRVFFNLLQKAGIEGRYQITLGVIMSLISYLTGGMMLITPYLFYQDPYVCPSQGLSSSKSCLDFVCSLPSEQRAPYIPEPSIYTLGNKFGDYRCQEDKLQLEFVMTMMYVGNVVGFLGVTLVGDLVGRKRLMIGNLLVAFVGLLITMFCVSLSMAAAGLFLVTCGIQNSFNVCFYFISQTMSEHQRQMYQVLIQLFYGLGVLINVLWYYAVGDWQLIFAIFYFIPLVAAIVGMTKLVKDTPICLVMRYTARHAHRDFKYIAKLNKNTFQVSVDEIASIKVNYQLKLQGQNNSKKSFNVLDLFRYKSLRMMTIMLIILQCTVIFEFYAPALMLDKFDMSLYINGIVVGVSQLISYPLCFYMISRVGRKKTAYGCFSGTFLCSMILIFLWNQNGSDDQDIGSSIGVLSLIFIFRFAIALQYTYFYVYFNELFPTQIRVLGTGLVSTMGGVMVTLAPIIIEKCTNSSFPIMVIFAILSGASIFISYMLPETLGVPPEDEIKELREATIEADAEKVKAMVEAERMARSSQLLIDQDDETFKSKSLLSQNDSIGAPVNNDK